MDEIIKNNLIALKSLCEHYDVKTMHLFGSSSSGVFGNSSDIDILISFKDVPYDRYTDNFFNLHQALEKLLNRKVDLITERSLSNPYFIQSVEATKRLLYAA